MKHKVISKFVDSDSGRFYPANSFYEGEDAERVLFLNKNGLIELNKEFEAGGTSDNSTKNSKSTNKDADTTPKKSSKKSTPKEKEVKEDE